MKKTNLSFIFIFFILITFFRIYLFIYPSFNIDTGAWQAWAERLYSLGSGSFYSTSVWTNYTPGYLSFLWILGLFTFGIFKISFFSINFIYIIKITTLLFDLLTSVLIYKILEKHQNKFLGILGFIFYYANPAVIFDSSVWGQIDGVLTFFILASAYLLYERKKISLSTSSLAFSLLIKPQALAIFPIYGLIFIKRYFNNIIYAIVPAFIIFLIFSVLFFPSNLFFGLLSLIIQMSKDYSFTSLYAFNLWAIVGWWQKDSLLFGGFSYQILGILIYLITVVIILIPVAFKKISSSLYYFGYSLLLIAFYLFPTRVHERYILPFFALFIIATFLTKSKLMLCMYFVISTISFLNLWYVYYVFILKNNSSTHLLFSLIDHNYKSLSFILIVVFFIITIVYFRLVFAEKKVK